jgi:hypothetical protein
MARPCSICTDPKLRETVDRLIAEGVSDHETARRVGAVSRMAVTRHRNAHVLAPARQQLAVLDKGQTAARERRELAQAAAEDAPSPADFVKAAFGLEATARRLQRIEERLERMADRAEQVGSSSGVAALAAQQLRGVEVGARLAGAGGYATPRTLSEGERPTFSVTINLGGQTITVGAQGGYGISPPPAVDAELADAGDPMDAMPGYPHGPG